MYCNQQLADFQKWLSKLVSEDAKVFAGSVDSVEDAKKMVEKNGLTFPVAYGMNAEEISKMTGAFYDVKKGFLQPTGFLLKPDHALDMACYSTGPAGRLTARDLYGVVKFYNKIKEDKLKMI